MENLSIESAVLYICLPVIPKLILSCLSLVRVIAENAVIPGYEP